MGRGAMQTASYSLPACQRMSSSCSTLQACCAGSSGRLLRLAPVERKNSKNAKHCMCFQQAPHVGRTASASNYGQGSRTCDQTESASFCSRMGGRGESASMARVVPTTARTHSMRWMRFRCSSTKVEGGVWKSGSRRRMENSGNIISLQCPMAVCRQTHSGQMMCMSPVHKSSKCLCTVLRARLERGLAGSGAAWHACHSKQLLRTDA